MPDIAVPATATSMIVPVAVTPRRVRINSGPPVSPTTASRGHTVTKTKPESVLPSPHATGLTGRRDLWPVPRNSNLRSIRLVDASLQDGQSYFSIRMRGRSTDMRILAGVSGHICHGHISSSRRQDLSRVFQ